MTRNDTTYATKTTRAALRLLLLLLMMAGGSGAWADDAHYLDKIEYGSTSTTDGWSTSVAGRFTPVILNEGDNYFLSVTQDQRNNNGCVVTGTTLAGQVAAGCGFILTFDLRISSSTNQWPTSFEIRDVENSSTMFSLTATGTSVTTWKLNGGDELTLPNTNKGGSTETIADVPWYTVTIKRRGTNTYVTIVNKGTGVAICTDKAVTASTTGGLGNMVFTTKRYDANFAIDNIEVKKWGWDASEKTVNLAHGNWVGNTFTGMPSLWDNSETVTNLTYIGSIFGDGQGFTTMADGKTWADYYPPRLKATGEGTVSVQVGGTTTQYQLFVNSQVGGGTYDNATRTYTFTQEGVIPNENRVISSVPNIAMSFEAGGPTAVVVPFEGGPGVRIIDDNGWSHSNVGDAVTAPLPPETNYGGTFFKFMPTANGTLTVNGDLPKIVLYKSDKTQVSLGGSGNTRTATLDAGYTYYLFSYDSGTNSSDIPVLHSFKFIPSASAGLTFRNSIPMVTVDAEEGSYTNTAVSAAGYPVSYSITQGSEYVDGDPDDMGKVTFRSNINHQAYVTVKATAGTESVSYTICLVKHTWIFDSQSRWSTTVAELGTRWISENWNGYKRDGTPYYRDADGVHYNWESLKTTAGDLPETNGLLFFDDNKNNRIIITPNDLSTSKYYLGATSTFIGIDNVKAGQTVTASWYATSSEAIVNISDAADEESVGRGRNGTNSLTATADGRVTLRTNGTTSYIRSIKLSTPTRAIGTLTYPKTVLITSETMNRTGYTITDESGFDNLIDAYSQPTNFMSNNESVATVDGSGNITAHGVGVAVISAMATAKNSGTHQSTVMMVATVEVLADASTRIRTIEIEDLLYNANVSAADGLDRRIPGFDLTFTGGDGAKCNSTGSLLLRQNSGQMTITPRAQGGETVYITQALLTVKAAESGATFTVNSGTSMTATAGGIALTTGDIGTNQTQLVLKSSSTESFEIVSVKIYYRCVNAENADYCLDDTKVSPQLSFATDHIMRIPGDGRAFTQNPTLTPGDYFKSFNISYTFNSSNTTIATINADGSGGQLHASGQASITARFSETNYFAEATAKYNVSNTLLPGESYGDISINNGQFIHISAKAGADETPLTLSGTVATSLTYRTEQTRRNTSANANGSVTLTNDSSQPITIYWVHVVNPSLRAWLYYAGQEENYMEQVQFAGFQTGSIAGFRVMDVGEPDNPIDITDAYSLKEGSTFTVVNSAILSDLNSGTGNALAAAGTTTIMHSLTKTGQADGYDDEITASATVNVFTFDKNHPVTWSFINNVADADNTLGTGWTYDDRGFQYGYFADYMPILNFSGSVYAPDDAKQMHGVMLKDEFRWYSSDPLRGLRANLSQPKASIKFPVKKGMEIVINVATSSADVSNTITNVTDVNGAATSTLYIQDAGDSNPINAYFLAASDGVVELKSADKVGMYLKSITLRVPKIHFTDEITTVLTTGTVVNEPINIPSGRNITCTITSASKFDSEGNEEVLSPVNFDQVATIDDPTKSIVSLKGQEGIITVHVVNNDATGIEANEGDYTLHIVDFRFDPNEETLNLDDNYNKEKDFSRRPIGINKVGTPINYSFEIPSGSNAKAMMSQSTNVNPALTTYLLTTYNKGTINVIAQTGRITTQCTLTVTGHTFGKSVDVLSESEITSNSYTYEIALPEGYVDADLSHWTLTSHFSGDFPTTPTVTANTSSGKLVISNLYGTSATARNHGAIRVIATHDNWNSDPDDDNYTQFTLTLSYPASSGKKWDFYRSTTGLKAQTDHDNKIGDYSGTHLNPQTVSDYVITGTNGWTTDTSWKKIYRNGDKEPRWAYTGSVKCDNAFIIEETAGLQIETPKESFYVDNNATASYCHIGLHSHSTVTIPKLKQGDFVRLNMSRVIPNNGAIIEARNVTDLAGTPITEKFTITRSQIDYKENGVLATDENGSRIIPGYYTFIVANDGDASFTLSDEGYLDLLSVEIYDKDADIADTYLGTKADDGYQHTMTKVKLSSSGYPFAPTTMLKENDAQELVNLSFCHPMWSTSVGPCDYQLRGAKPITDNINATMENVGWYSNGGAYYVDGLITVNEGYGKITLRMNNYTAEGKYLIGYTPDYTLTVGHLPHQDYPYTWNFTNISGGRVNGDYNNAYNSVNGDASTWGAMGGNVFQLDTDTEGGSFYVPGATLVSTPRDLGMKGTKPALDAAGTGCDEFNGLGFNGEVMFRTADQSALARADAPRKAPASTISLLEYKMSNPNYTYGTDLPAGNGTIHFGANKREQTIVPKETGKIYSECGYGFRLDGELSYIKWIKLMPMRPFKEGDVIVLKVYTDMEPSTGDGCGINMYPSTELDATLYDGITLATRWYETEVTYTIPVGSGLIGQSEVFLFRKGKTTCVSEVSITGTVSTSLSQQMLYAVTPTTITIPDLNADGKQDWIYVKASREPTAVTNATKVSSGSDGPDAATGVYKYKVTAAGKSDVTFNGDTEIDQIGVTHILKQMTQAGDKAWATESRDHSIDHSLTGYFTSNDVNAHTVTIVDASSTANRTTVRLNAIAEDGYVPEMTGLVLRSDDLTYFPTTNSYSTADAQKITGNVPLFYPAMTTEETSTAVNFPTNNLMYHRAGSDADNEFGYEESWINGMMYYKFILAKRYKTWRKDNGVLTSPSGDYEYQDAAVFYRFHKEDDAGLNTLGKYKAYLLLPADKVPPALWKAASPSRRYIPILGVSDMEEDFDSESTDGVSSSEKTYNLRGQVIDADGALPPGVYIRNGKKIIIK